MWRASSSKKSKRRYGATSKSIPRIRRFDSALKQALLWDPEDAYSTICSVMRFS